MAGAALAGMILAGASARAADVTYERLLKPEPHNWLHNHHDYAAQRYSALDAINKGNVKGLKLAYAVPIGGGAGNEYFEATPLVDDGFMYYSDGWGVVYKVDARSGKRGQIVWKMDPGQQKIDRDRGVALWGNLVISVTGFDGRVIATNKDTGQVVWDKKIGDHQDMELTAAPLALKDSIIIGASGGDLGVRCWIAALDPKTGEMKWKTYSIPAPGEPGSETWKDKTNNWQTGGGAFYVTGSYDPDTNTLFWGTSNPWPDYNGDFRAGDNLYSCSVLALDPDTGKLKWHYQFTPHDLHDWDSTQNPVLVDTEFEGQMRKTLAWPNRNGFFYLIDRTNGKFMSAKAFVKQTWNAGFDPEYNGRPKLVPGNDPTPDGLDTVWPGIDGGANWMAHSYSPLTKFLYVFAREEHRLYTKNEVQHPTTEPNTTAARTGAGAFNRARGPRFAPEESWGKAIAIDPGTGEIKWEYKVVSPPWGGLMSTAGNLVFGGTFEGVLFALNATTGERLWTFAGNGPVYATAISYLVDGKQYISIPTGDVIVTFGLD